MKRASSSWAWKGATCAWIAVASAAHAEPTAADKETARALLLDGRAKLAANDAAGALRSFEGAHAIMNVPTTGLDLAKAQAALGQLVEARETALSVTRMPSKDGEPEAFVDARRAAEELAAGLAPRIPSLILTVKGPALAAASVTVDGAVVAAVTLSLPRKVNPGRHRVVVTAPGFAEAAREVDVAEGQALAVELSLARAVTGVVSAGPVTTVAPGPTAGATAVASGAATGGDATGDAGTASRRPVWAWVSGAAGLVALGVGVGFFVDYMGVRARVASECPGDVCDPARHDAASAQALRAQWNRDLGLGVGLGALGLVGVGVAIVGFSGGASSKGPPSAAMVRVRPGGLSLEGAF